jgi:hypothetical protein
MKKYFKWITESNRPKHLVAGLVIAMLFGVVTAIVAALAAEYKDWAYKGCKGWPVTKNGFDWLDIAATVIGGAIVAIGYALDGCSISSPFTGLI